MFKSLVLQLRLLLLPFLLSLLCLGTPAVSAPQRSLQVQGRQTWSVGWWSRELEQYGCRPTIFIFAKATWEPGNMGTTIGPTLSDSLKIVFGVTNVATQGVDYYGFIGGNYYPGGAPPWAIYDMQAIITAATACPHSKIVVSGYSQGAAIVHRAIEALPVEIRSRVAGVVTFGDTQTLQDGGRIAGYPANQTLIICNYGDIVCVGTMVPIYPVHWDYVKWVPTATLFLAQTILAANATDPWPTGSILSVDIDGLGELAPGADLDVPVATKVVAYNPPPVATGGVGR
ncbi:cutinase-domain-containing protein [Nemania sp. FL0916]|nr:cutinase-domain-containing protein [Nemania sp. FL0916]